RHHEHGQDHGAESPNRKNKHRALTFLLLPCASHRRGILIVWGILIIWGVPATHRPWVRRNE
ncbi:MAG: hypothetical protein RLN99_09360, partial [Kiloniellaceae bacterium]